MPLLDDKSRKENRTQSWVAEPGLVPSLELDRPALCSAGLGDPFEKLERLGAADGGTFGSEGEYVWRRHGLAVGLSRGRCASFRVYFADEEGFAPFVGRCLVRGEEVSLSVLLSEETFVARFGPPYWRDEDEDGEALLFYEPASVEKPGASRVEWQVEFDEAGRLACLVLLTPPSLERPGQREAYGVTKPWPP